MIRREDFAAIGADQGMHENVMTIAVRDFTDGALLGNALRKPDFQRETNHWRPEQVARLLECFVSGDLIPSVILWQSPTCVFVIDGGHRLSALRAWIEDDYGDGPISQAFFGYDVSTDQRKVADQTRALVKERVGTWLHYKQQSKDDNLDPVEKRRVNTVIARGIPIQWVKGDADRAETSFFTINTKGTALDDVEELLLKNRKKPLSIASRAIVRAGRGHKYWSGFPQSSRDEIEEKAKLLHQVLFEPEMSRPVKTLDLPLGGPKGVRTALEALIELNLIASRNQQGVPKTVAQTDDDDSGEKTVQALTRTLLLMQRITGNSNGSLGLHPAVFFYGPTGRHSGPMFMGTVALFASKLISNNKEYFQKFTSVRSKVEAVLISNKDLIATILQRALSNKRAERYRTLLESLIDAMHEGKEVSPQFLVDAAGLAGKVVTGGPTVKSDSFTDDTKSQVFIHAALSSALKCSVCSGYLDVTKSVSYDHSQRIREGGLGTAENCELTHPYCNQSVKR
jgi:Protein of unknown function DUF262